MPNTLHYLYHCLRLIPDDVHVVLVFNGASTWERKMITEAFANRPTIDLRTLPGSSISHGYVLNILFTGTDRDFGIIDHDLFIFDDTVFKELSFQGDVFMKAIFAGENRFTGMVYPHTFFMYFNVEKIKSLMKEYEIDARIYKNIPSKVASEIATIGLSGHSYMKDYIKYYDTLQILIALAYVRGWLVDYLETKDVYHVGGTSIGSQYSKDLSRMYISMCYLEYTDSDRLKEKYLPYLKPYTSSTQIKEKLKKDAETMQMINSVHLTISRLQKKSTEFQ